MRRLLAAAIILMLCPPRTLAQTADLDRGAGIYSICGACHGPAGQGTESLGAPPLAGQWRWYLLRQLHNFQSGARGSKADPEGQEMQQILATVPAESDWQAVIEFIATMPAPFSGQPSGAAAARGQQIYATCAACHGPMGEGNESLNAPSLSHLPAWYIAAQLHKFRRGVRGGMASDEPGNRMRAVAATLSSEKDLAAVSNYIEDQLYRGGH